MSLLSVRDTCPTLSSIGTINDRTRAHQEAHMICATWRQSHDVGALPATAGWSRVARPGIGRTFDPAGEPDHATRTKPRWRG